MQHQILRGVLTSEELQQIRQELDPAQFRSGLETNPMARGLKQNLQADPVNTTSRSSQLVQQALYRHPGFGPYVLPKRASLPFFARYTEGMYYGPHIDEPLLRGQTMLRTDLSCTIFISEPEDSEGGELVVGDETNSPGFKLAAGDALIYLANSVHQVTQVTAGIRIVALCWFESLVRDAEQRRLLVDLDKVLADLIAASPEATETAGKVAQIRANLIRMWADP